MLLQQETGNKKHILFEHSANENFDFPFQTLVICVYFDSVLLTIFDNKTKNIINLKVCDISTYKKDIWLTLNFSKVLMVDNNFKINYIPSDFIFEDFDRFGFKLNYSEDSVISGKHLFVTCVIEYFKNITTRGQNLIIDVKEDSFAFILIKDCRFVCFNSFTCLSKEELLFFTSSICKINAVDFDSLNILLNYNMKSHNTYIDYLNLFFKNVDFLKSGCNIEFDYAYIKERLFAAEVRIACE